MGIRWNGTIAAAAVLLLGACTSTGDQYADVDASNQGQVVNNTETAPADLQLTCASAAASQYGIPADKLLPTASSKQPDGTYNVQLTSEGASFLCKIDDNANVISVLPA